MASGSGASQADGAGLGQSGRERSWSSLLQDVHPQRQGPKEAPDPKVPFRDGGFETGPMGPRAGTRHGDRLMQEAVTVVRGQRAVNAQLQPAPPISIEGNEAGGGGCAEGTPQASRVHTGVRPDIAPVSTVEASLVSVDGVEGKAPMHTQSWRV